MCNLTKPISLHQTARVVDLCKRMAPCTNVDSARLCEGSNISEVTLNWSVFYLEGSRGWNYSSILGVYVPEGGVQICGPLEVCGSDVRPKLLEPELPLWRRER